MLTCALAKPLCSFLTAVQSAPSLPSFGVTLHFYFYFTPRGRFPRVFGDEFGEEFGDKFGDDFSESLNLVMNLVENLATNLVIHQNW